MIRVVSWNVRDLSGDPSAVRAVLQQLRGDVVCLQEAPRRPGSALRIAGLARGAGLVHVTGGRGSGGTALLVGDGVRVAGARRVRLPVPHWYARTRGAVLAEVMVKGAELAVVNVHLPLQPHQRLDHARRVRAELTARLDRSSAGAAGRLLVAGDFNEVAGSPAWQVFEPLARDPRPDASPTFPARDPRGRIDAVLVGAALTVVEYSSGGVDAQTVRRASDHLPVLAVVQPG